MKANISAHRVTKCLRHCGKDLKAERAPQPDRRRIGFDDSIELHSPVPIGPCLLQDPATEGPSYPLTAPRRVDNEPGVGDVRSGTRVVGVRIRAPDHTSMVIDSDNGARWQFSHPACTRPGFGCRGVPRQCLASSAYLFEYQPDSRPVLCSCLA
jgi:hypothetical protein